MSKKQRKAKQRVKIRRMSWDANFYKDLMDGTGFIITEPAEVTLDGTREKALYGAQSPLYGTSYSDDQAYIERHRCKCGAFASRLFEGETCPICHTKVQSEDPDIRKTGWISLGINRIINPYYYNLMCNVIGKNVFPDIIYIRAKITTDGKRERPTDDDMEGYVPSSPYAGIGVDAFFANYENIMEYFKSVKKNKKKQIQKLIEQKRFVFTSHIPIYSTMLRPQSSTADSFYYVSMDKLINTLFTLSENIKDCADIDRDYILTRLQKKVNQMWDTSFEMLKGKDGFIRDQMLGGSLKCWVNLKTLLIAGTSSKVITTKLRQQCA